LNQEEINSKQIANALMIAMAKSSTETNSSFASWLLAGSSAAFALVLTNIDSLSKFVDASAIKEALFLFLFSVGIAIVQKWLNSIIIAGLKGGEEGAKIDAVISQSGLIVQYELVLKAIEDAAWYPAKYFIRNQYNKLRAGDILAGGRVQLKLAQAHGFLMLAQGAIAIFSLAILISGIKV
jgi:hypothetical protein